MTKEFLTLEPRPIVDLGEIDRSQLVDSANPWLVISHNAPKTMEEANEIQDEISNKLVLGELVEHLDKPFTTGSAWHDDGFYHTPLINQFTTYSVGTGVLYLAHGLAEQFGKPIRPSHTEREVVDAIADLQTDGKIGRFVVRIPFKAGISAFWREIKPSPNIPDVAHATFAGPGRTTAVTERLVR